MKLNRRLGSIALAVSILCNKADAVEYSDHWACRGDFVNEWTVLPDGTSRPAREQLTIQFDVEIMNCKQFATILGQSEDTKWIAETATSDCERNYDEVYAYSGDFNSYHNFIYIRNKQSAEFLTGGGGYIYPNDERVSIHAITDHKIESLSLVVGENPADSIYSPYILSITKAYKNWQFSLAWESLTTDEEADKANVLGANHSTYTAHARSFYYVGNCVRTQE